MLSTTVGSQLRINFFTSSSSGERLTFPTGRRNPNPQISAFIKQSPSTSSPNRLFSHFQPTPNATRITFPATASCSFPSSSSASSSQAISALDAPAADDDDHSPPNSEKLGVLVKLVERQRLVLKFIWMESNVGIALDLVIPGHGSIPLSPYYFWPRKDAWEELKINLESKPWISQKQVVVLLNHATDVMNLWQQNLGDLS